MPKSVCSYCVDTLNHFISFRLRAIENDTLLRRIIATQSTNYYKDESNIYVDDITINNETDDCKNKCDIEETDLNLVKNENNNFECNICKKQVKTIHSLRRHMKIHSGIKPHGCTLCGKRFLEQGNLTKHLRNHNKDKKHQCNECGLRFYERNKLMIHIRTHTGEKPFTCKICSRAFATHAQVQIHMKVRNKNNINKFACRQLHLYFKLIYLRTLLNNRKQFVV